MKPEELLKLVDYCIEYMEVLPVGEPVELSKFVEWLTANKVKGGL